ncbi:MAG: hypothetical protein FWF10_05405 [Clostridiales bacterium]|nr:hypothetical protein [Clostridiales bacterium]
MSFNSKKSIASMVAGALMLIAYAIYALGAHAPAADDLKPWALALLVFIGIGVVAVIVIQILFHIATAIGIAVREQERDRKKIDRRFASLTVEDERDKLIGLKSSHISSIVAGIGFVAALVGLAFGASAVFALHILLGACAVGSAAEGIASVYFYEKGVRNG